MHYEYNEDDFSLIITHPDSRQEHVKMYPDGTMVDEQGAILGTIDKNGNFEPITEQEERDYRIWKANGGDGSFAVWKNSGKPVDTSTTKEASNVDDIINSSTEGRPTKGRSKLFEKKGGLNQANKDFDGLIPSEVKDIPGGRVGKLSDGSIVIVRSKSSDGRPTLEVQKGKNKIKFRYDTNNSNNLDIENE